MLKNRRLLLALLSVFILVAAACGGDSDESADETEDAVEATGDDTESEETDDGGETDETPAPAPEGEIDRDATLIYATSFVANSLDVPRVSTDFAFTHVDPIYDTLVRRTAGGELVPGVADSWEVTAESITFTIADGRTFHDDTPIDAEAVKANLDRIINCECRFDVLLSAVSSVEADGNQVVLNLTEPAGSLLEVLSDIPGMLASPASFENEDLDVNPVGSGPFTVREYTDGGISYDKWDGYHDADSIQYAALEVRSIPDDNTRISGYISGELDIGLARLGQLAEAEAGGLTILTQAQAQVYQLVVETDRGPLADPDVRRAISHALDREAISQGLYDGNCTPTVQPYPEGFPGYVADATVERYAAYDPDLARQLLADAGYPDGFEINMGAPAITNYTNQLEIYQAQLAEIGITVEAVPDESRTFVERLSAGEYDTWLGPNTTARPSSINFWRAYYAPDGARNSGGYELPDIANLIAATESAPSAAEQTAALETMVSTSLDEGARAIIVCAPKIVAVHNDNIGGYEIPLAGNNSLRDVYKTAG